MGELVRVGLGDGGRLLLESVGARAGPVRAGRASDLVEDLGDNLRDVLRPVTQASREILAELRASGPEEIAVEFGVTLSVGAGAVIATSTAGCHFKVTLGWKREDGDGPAHADQ